MSASWSENPEYDECLRDWIAQKFSMSQIANKLTKKFGREFTRNACCGRAHRLGIKGDKAVTYAKSLKNLEKARAAPRPTPRGPRKSPPKIKLVPIVCEDLPVIGPEPLHICLHQLNKNTCRWPCGAFPYSFCGHPPLEGLPYCPAHTRVSLRASERERVPA